MATRTRPGEDVPVRRADDLTVINAIDQYRKEAEQAKRARKAKNLRNWEAYLSHQDFSGKQVGQSTEFLPETGMAVEQFAAFIKRALVQFGQWFSVDLPNGFPISEQNIKDLINCFLNRIPNGTNKWTTFPLRLSDGIKAGLLESLIILKVHGRRVEERRFFAESGISIVETETGEVDASVEDRLERQTVQNWRLLIDVVRADDYFPDPTGRNLYEIHRVERDLHDVIALSEGDDPIYDPAAVGELETDFVRQEAKFREAQQKNQEQAGKPSFRKTIIIDEFWGDLLDSKGKIVESNVMAAVANEQFLIRKPESNPFWHGESPFVVSPIVRVPGSVWHKALYDDAVPLNFALNEIFNLMLDGGISSVWGIKQVRPDYLIDPTQISGGIQQGVSLAIKEEVPLDAKVVERVDSGEAPQESLEIFRVLQRQFQGAALTNDLKLGLFPPKQVLATEVVEQSQSQSVTLDSIAADVEQELIGPVLRKAWFNILQNAENLDDQDVVNAVGARAALLLTRMPTAERFARLSQGCAFKVHGLSSTLARVRDFQKFMALMQAIIANPVLLQAFMRTSSPEKMLNHMMKTLNINPENIQLTDDEKQELPGRLKELAQFQQLTGNNNGQGLSAEQTGDSSLPAEINQASNPLTGLVG